MSSFTDTLTLVLAIGALGFAAAGFVMLVALLRPRRRPAQAIKRASGTFIYSIGLGIALATTALSLVYSEVIGYAPCELCWWQRIAIYPQIPLFAIGLITSLTARTGSRELLMTSLFLSGAGAVAAVYHIGLQAFSAPGFLCVTGGGVSCSERYFNVFGFISFPVLSLIIFLFLTIVVGYALWHHIGEQGPNRSGG